MANYRASTTPYEAGLNEFANIDLLLVDENIVQEVCGQSYLSYQHKPHLSYDTSTSLISAMKLV
jgi:hypothetical protein